MGTDRGLITPSACWREGLRLGVPGVCETWVRFSDGWQTFVMGRSIVRFPNTVRYR